VLTEEVAKKIIKGAFHAAIRNFTDRLKEDLREIVERFENNAAEGDNGEG